MAGQEESPPLKRRRKELLDEIQDRVLAKDDLDFQYTWQSLVKGWLLLHLPLSCALVPLVAVHIVVNYAFSLGGL